MTPGRASSSLQESPHFLSFNLWTSLIINLNPACLKKQAGRSFLFFFRTVLFIRAAVVFLCVNINTLYASVVQWRFRNPPHPPTPNGALFLGWIKLGFVILMTTALLVSELWNKAWFQIHLVVGGEKSFLSRKSFLFSRTGLFKIVLNSLTSLHFNCMTTLNRFNLFVTPPSHP